MRELKDEHREYPKPKKDGFYTEYSDGTTLMVVGYQGLEH